MASLQRRQRAQIGDDVGQIGLLQPGNAIGGFNASLGEIRD
jgi:hypothetical protein